MTILFFVLAALYFLVARKVDYWITIALLGFKSECPEFFIRKERIYHYAVWLLFLPAVAVGVVSSLSGWIVGPLMLILWLLSGSAGHASAYRKYREIMRDLKETAESPQEAADMDREIAKTDAELRDLVTERAKWK